MSFYLHLDHLSSTLLPLTLPDPPTSSSSLSVPGKSTTASCPVKPQHRSTQIVKLSSLTTSSTPPGLTCSRSSNSRYCTHQTQPVYSNLNVISNPFWQTGSICTRSCAQMTMTSDLPHEGEVKRGFPLKDQFIITHKTELKQTPIENVLVLQRWVLTQHKINYSSSPAVQHRGCEWPLRCACCGGGKAAEKLY